MFRVHVPENCVLGNLGLMRTWESRINSYNINRGFGEVYLSIGYLDPSW